MSVGEVLRAVDRDQDGVEPVCDSGFEAVEESAVRVENQRRDRGVAGDLADAVDGEEGFSPVEGQHGVGVLCKEPVEIGEIDIEIHREVFIDDDIGLIRRFDGECLPPAVGAAEVAVVGQDEVVVHGWSLTIWVAGRKKCEDADPFTGRKTEYPAGETASYA